MSKLPTHLKLMPLINHMTIQETIRIKDYHGVTIRCGAGSLYAILGPYSDYSRNSELPENFRNAS
jgi:hypothetical protein